MNQPHSSRSASSRLQILLSLLLGSAALIIAVLASGFLSGPSLTAQAPTAQQNSVTEGRSYRNDVSPPLYSMPPWSPADRKSEREANENPKVPYRHVDGADPVVQRMHTSSALALVAPSIAATLNNFDGIPFPGVGCSCAPPDTNGAVGKTQFVQIVNEGYQVFDKTTGASVLGPNSISSIWAGFGGACQTLGQGDPVVLYDQLADRWVISQFAKSTSTGPVTDECVAVSTTGDATGTYFRYGFHLGSNFFDYPHLSVWPDGYYMSMNVFNAAGTAFLGPQAFAFNRSGDGDYRRGSPAFVSSSVGPLGATIDLPFSPCEPSTALPCHPPSLHRRPLWLSQARAATRIDNDRTPFPRRTSIYPGLTSTFHDLR